eukprot:scaffold909_cov575-Prasinococcus_capsulatus_cf.AAC.10
MAASLRATATHAGTSAVERTAEQAVGKAVLYCPSRVRGTWGCYHGPRPPESGLPRVLSVASRRNDSAPSLGDGVGNPFRLTVRDTVLPGAVVPAR